MLAAAINKLASALLGGTCYLCRGAAPGELLCPACLGELPRPGPACPCCGLASASAAACGRCLAKPPRFDATLAVLVYAFPVDVLVHALKFRGELALAPRLGALLAERVTTGEPVDLIVPVPLSAARLRSRGYNQALEIARAAARATGARLDPLACVRERDTVAQTGLPWADRSRNVRGAFDCRRALEGRTVAVVDDVMTTGATLEELAATLKRAGARRVVNWVLARTPAA